MERVQRVASRPPAASKPVSASPAPQYSSSSSNATKILTNPLNRHEPLTLSSSTHSNSTSTSVKQPLQPVGTAAAVVTPTQSLRIGGTTSPVVTPTTSATPTNVNFAVPRSTVSPSRERLADSQPAPRALPQLRQPSPTRREESYRPLSSITPQSQQRLLQRKSMPQASPLAAGARSPRSQMQPVDPTWADLANRYYNDEKEMEREERTDSRGTRSESPSSNYIPKLIPLNSAPQPEQQQRHTTVPSLLNTSNGGEQRSLSSSSTMSRTTAMSAPPPLNNMRSQPSNDAATMAAVLPSVPSNLTATSSSTGSSSFHPVPTEVHSAKPTTSSSLHATPIATSPDQTKNGLFEKQAQPQQSSSSAAPRRIDLRLAALSSQLSDSNNHPLSATAPKATNSRTGDGEDVSSNHTQSFHLADVVEVSMAEEDDVNPTPPLNTNETQDTAEVDRTTPSKTELTTNAASSTLIAASLIVHRGEESTANADDRRVSVVDTRDRSKELRENRMVRLSEWCNDVPQFQPLTTSSSRTTLRGGEETPPLLLDPQRPQPYNRRAQRSSSIQFLQEEGGEDIMEGGRKSLSRETEDEDEDTGGLIVVEPVVHARVRAAISPDHDDMHDANKSEDEASTTGQAATAADLSTLHSPSQKKHWLTALRHAQAQAKAESEAKESRQRQDSENYNGQASYTSSTDLHPPTGRSGSRRPTFLNIVAALVKQKHSSRGLRLGITGNEVLTKRLSHLQGGGGDHEDDNMGGWTNGRRDPSHHDEDEESKARSRFRRATESVRHALVFDPNSEDPETVLVTLPSPQRSPASPHFALSNGGDEVPHKNNKNQNNVVCLLDVAGEHAVSENPSELESSGSDDGRGNHHHHQGSPLPRKQTHQPSQQLSAVVLSPTDPSLNSSMSTRSGAPLVGQRTLSVKTVPTRDLLISRDQASRDLFYVNMSVVEMSEEPTKRRGLFSR